MKDLGQQKLYNENTPECTSTSPCYLQLLVKRPKPNKMMLRFTILQAIFNLLVLRRLKERKDKVIERPMIHINLCNTRIFITSTFFKNKHYKIQVHCCWQKKPMRSWRLFLPSLRLVFSRHKILRGLLITCHLEARGIRIQKRSVNTMWYNSSTKSGFAFSLK